MPPAIRPSLRRLMQPGLPDRVVAVSATTKVCTTCGIEKHLPEFYLRRTSGRRRHECRACHRARVRRHYAQHRDHILQAKAHRLRTEDPDTKRRRNRRKQDARDAKRQRARHVARRLRQLGLVQIGDACADCGGPATDLHHRSYDDLVDLISLCHACHMARHFAHWRKHGGGPVKYPDEYEENA